MSDLNWSTSIAAVEVDDVIVRGHRLSDLVGSMTYAEMAFLLIRGTPATAPERMMLDGVLVSLADHGISPTTIVARTLASCGTPIQASMAGAILSVADWHGGSGEEVGALLTEIVDGTAASDETEPGARRRIEDACEALVTERRAAGNQIPGFGHPQHTDGDPRAIQLLTLAGTLQVAGDYCRALDALGVALHRATGRVNLRSANVTGALAAILLDLGFPWRAIRGIVIAARSLGLTAHVVEELAQGNRWRHAPAESVSYTGERPA